MDVTAIDQNISENRFAEAIALLEAVPPQAREAAVWDRLGRCFVATAAHAKGIGAYKEAHRLDPQDWDILSRLFNACIWAGRFRDARGVRRLCRRTGFPEWRLLDQDARLLVQRGRLTRARDAWLRAATLCPDAVDRAWIYWRVADVLIRRGHAVVALEILPDADVGGENYLLLKASAYSALGMRRELAAVVDEAIAMGYSSPGWARHRAKREWLAGRRAEGATVLERYVDANPGNAAALAQLAEYYQRMGLKDNASECARRADCIKPRDKEVSRIVVRVLWDNGHRLEALGLIRHCRPSD